MPAISSFRLTDDHRRIRAVEDAYDLADLMRQLGFTLPYTPAPGLPYDPDPA